MTFADPSPGLIHVVAAALTDDQGRVLIAQRPPGKAMAGSWEFPGGKVEAGESRRQALGRELREELGIGIGEPRPLIRVPHTYPFGEVLIDMWVVNRYDGTPRGLDGQQLRWCTPDELSAAELLPADKPILAALRLPAQLEMASSPSYYIRALGSIRTEVGKEVPHQDRLCGVFCSNVFEAADAVRADADFLVLSQVLPRDELATLCRLVSLPVYARGLVAEAAWALGASGVNTIDE